MAGHEVKEFAASIVGMIQGCTLRVLLFDLVMKTWARSVKAETVIAMAKVHDADAGVLSEVGEDVDVQKNQSLEHHRNSTAIGERLRVERMAS